MLDVSDVTVDFRVSYQVDSRMRSRGDLFALFVLFVSGALDSSCSDGVMYVVMHLVSCLNIQRPKTQSNPLLLLLKQTRTV